MARDNRKVNSNIITGAPQPVAKGPKTQLKSWGPDDDFDELENHLHADQIERLTTPHPETGVAPLEGNWKGRATRDEDGNIVPAKSAKKAEAEKPATLDDLTVPELKELADKNKVTVAADAHKADIVAALTKAGVKTPKK